jgi:hypothetical protein
MKPQILLIVGALGLVTVEELHQILEGYFGRVKMGTLAENLAELERRGALLRLTPEENGEGVEGYIPGPNWEGGEDLRIQRLVVEGGTSPRGLSSVRWEVLAERVLKESLEALEDLRESIQKGYGDPKELEMRYFDLSLRYHELYRYFFDRPGTEFLAPLSEGLAECREILNRLEF